MKKNFSDYLVALTVIACSLVLLGALTVALTGWRVSKKGRTLEVHFRDVTGIRVQSEVRYAGAPAGHVSAVRMLTPAERESAATEEEKRNAVRVTLLLDDHGPEIPEDTRVSLSADTLLGEKFVALSAGSASVPKLANGALLQGQGSGSLDTLIESIGPLVESLPPLVDSLKPLVKTADDALKGVPPLLQKAGTTFDTVNADTLPRVAKLTDGLKTTSETADAALKRVDKLLTETEGPIKADLEQLKGTLTQVKQTLSTADGVLGRTDKSLDARMKELGIVLQNLKVVSTHAKALTQTLGEKPSRLIFGGKAQKLTPESEILRSDKVLPATRE
jgi:phospholipid/cholesterol/gamma-HCH transport system substrate-binding protein